ncbi:MAG TPA: hypothetical protein VD811_16265 [Desulfuromonadales bacterium]|nr:hypothetical protein [Desulfuromonadales bacterium]
MKKVLTFAALIMLVTCGSAFAAALGQDTDCNPGESIYGGVDATQAASGVLLGKMSKGVVFRAQYDDSGYAAGTKHDSGTKAYGTAHDSTAIYFQEVGQDGEIPGLDSADNQSFATGWTEM